MASLAAAASLALSKVTKPKPRERVGFSLEAESSELLLHAASEGRLGYLSMEMKASSTLPCLLNASIRMSLFVFQERLPT